MMSRDNISTFFLNTGLAVLWVLVIVYIAFHAFQGSSGLGELKRLERRIVEVQGVAMDVEHERHVIERRLDALSEDSIDPDMLEEKVREKLGFVHPDELVLFVDASGIN
ncbi:hypothetical protein GCM10017044_24420 [Kordiimonas sediminis]|uniref:Septum formation initiator family protein n=1 Tax=Kordiimonas sediminis TaxID=1735581 RepID=A0A919AXN4_9PROT|nr:septum formation initiator family protein [Kordiimonas sediminis]GHF28335.1 hypothetical protein GCM10017044_24420 [Kordiimonas sediminis]